MVNSFAEQDIRKVCNIAFEYLIEHLPDWLIGFGTAGLAWAAFRAQKEWVKPEIAKAKKDVMKSFILLRDSLDDCIVYGNTSNNHLKNSKTEKLAEAETALLFYEKLKFSANESLNRKFQVLKCQILKDAFTIDDKTRCVTVINNLIKQL